VYAYNKTLAKVTCDSKHGNSISLFVRRLLQHVMAYQRDLLVVSQW